MAEGRPTVNSSLSVDNTVKLVTSIATGVLTAASNDNVQAVAILACEQLGATLAMSSEACIKVEKLAKRRHISHFMAGLAVQIGFAPNDSADQLASSEAGGKFSDTYPIEKDNLMI